MKRRTYLLGGLSALAAADASASAAPSHAVARGKRSRAETIAAGLKGPALLEACVRIRGRTDGKLVFGWLEALRSTYVQGEITPFCGIVAGTVSRFQQISEQVWEATTIEIAHYTDPLTGQLLEHAKMPSTGRTVAVPRYRFGPTKIRFALALDEWEEFAPAKLASNAENFAPPSAVHLVRSIGSVTATGSDIRLRTDEFGRVYPDRSKPASTFYREWMVWRADATSLASTRSPSVAADACYSSLSGWRPWMQMDGISGHTAENGFGGKAERLEDCPAAFLELTARLYPDVLDNPSRALQAAPRA